MVNNFVITIARGFGSGGCDIAEKLAASLGIPCYEKEILRMASDFSGLNERLFHEVDEKLRNSYPLFHLSKYENDKVVSPMDKKFESDSNLFNIQASIIKQLAETTSCVIVVKCADFVLKDRENVASFYIEAPRSYCAPAIMEKLAVTEKEADRLIEKTDKYRADYYKHYTKGNYWTNPCNYDLTLNTARVGKEKCVELLNSYIKMKFDF